MPAWEVHRLNIRPARVGDVPAIYELIRTFADRKLMIRRSMGELYESIREDPFALGAQRLLIVAQKRSVGGSAPTTPD